MDLKEFEPRVHPAKEIFKSNDIKIATVARALGFTYPYTVNILNGIIQPTPETEQKLKELTESIECTGKRA